MLTREQIEEIQTENRERGVSIKKLLKEKGISERQYYRWKRQYERPEAPEGFLPIVGADLPTEVEAHLSGTAPSSRVKSKTDAAGENWMSIEIRTVGGADMRIQGGLTPAMVCTILRSL